MPGREDAGQPGVNLLSPELAGGSYVDGQGQGIKNLKNFVEYAVPKGFKGAAPEPTSTLNQLDASARDVYQRATESPRRN
jgi:hypothetical protein